MRDIHKRLAVLEQRKVEEAGQPQLSLAQWVEWSNAGEWEKIYALNPMARSNMEMARQTLADFDEDLVLVGQNE